MIQIDGPRALSLLARAVEEQGDDYVYAKGRNPEVTSPGTYSGCWYQVGGTPSCGVGRALHFDGVPLQVLSAMDQPDDTSIHEVLGILAEAGFHLTIPAVKAFTTFQQLQDVGATWGEAFTAAKEALR